MRSRRIHRLSRRWRVGMVLLLAAAPALLTAPGAWAAGQAGYGCAPGFDVGGVTLEQFLNLPRNQAGLAAGKYDESSLVSKFVIVDHNGDGVICVKDVATLNGDAGPWPYFYNIADDNAAASTG
jgi:hypothetical protein